MNGIIILAAGASSRLGRPKQNLVYGGKTLLQRAIETALAIDKARVIVVLGANADVIRPLVENHNITIVQNDDWAEGMASSVRAGIETLKKSERNANWAILMLCDQPFVDAGILKTLIETSGNSGIVACAYNGTNGPPVLFGAGYFDELLLLKGAEGAKKVMKKHTNCVIELPFPVGGTDIDTEEDFKRLR